MNKITEQNVCSLKFNETLELEENIRIRRTIGGDFVLEYLDDYPVENLDAYEKQFYQRKVISCCSVSDNKYNGDKI